ncbi:protein tyrosine phosphatase, partial [Bifidobacterium adolescentis]
MHIMFVCTGNVCRSPMGELLMRRYLSGTSITVSSAGTHALVGHSIDPSSGRLMDSVGIDSSEFRSRQLTRELAESADLILCFEEEQRNNIVDMAPSVVRRTFLVTDFANMCLYCAQHDLVKGLTVQERLTSVIETSSFVRPMIPVPRDVEDPFTKDFPVFRKAANQTNKAIWIILNSMRKHYRVNGAPARTMI